MKRGRDWRAWSHLGFHDQKYIARFDGYPMPFFRKDQIGKREGRSGPIFTIKAWGIEGRK